MSMPSAPPPRPAGPPDLLPQRRPGAGEAGQQHRVETADVDAELERVGRRHAEQPAAAQVVLERTPLLGQVAAAVGVDPGGQRGLDLVEQVGRALRHLLHTAPRPHEGERAHALDHEVREQVGRLGGRGAAYGSALLSGVRGQRRLPQPHRDLAARRVVVGDGRDVEPGQPAGGHLRLGHRGRRQDEGRDGAVGRAHPPQPAQHLRDVGAEHAAVVVALVDDDVVDGREEPGPSVVGGQQRAVQHVGVGQDVLGVVAGPVALLLGAVAVVRRDPDVEAERADRRALVLGERLRGREVERARAALAARAATGPDRGQRRQQVGERLPRGGAGRQHDVSPACACSAARTWCRQGWSPPARRRRHDGRVRPAPASPPRRPAGPGSARGGSAGRPGSPRPRAAPPAPPGRRPDPGRGARRRGRRSCAPFSPPGPTRWSRCRPMPRARAWLGRSWFDIDDETAMQGWTRGPELSTREVGGRTVIAVGGEIDVYTAPKLRDTITELVAAGTTTSSSTWSGSSSSTPPASACSSAA